ncbi:MAG: SDR family oxidoreductase, partial [Eubacteriales bacterium]|nr:SDR family oxidoreductase [Eubacteriales bacterium]
GTALEQKVLQDVTAAEWDGLMKTNLRGAFLCSREALSDMVSAKKGSIVSVSSIWGAVGGSCEVSYAASKAGLIGFTRSLAREVGPSGIRVNAVAPGFIDTKMNAHLSPDERNAFSLETPLERVGTPEEAAKAIVYLALDADFITGQTLCVDGGYTA